MRKFFQWLGLIDKDEDDRLERLKQRLLMELQLEAEGRGAECLPLKDLFFDLK